MGVDLSKEISYRLYGQENTDTSHNRGQEYVLNANAKESGDWLFGHINTPIIAHTTPSRAKTLEMVKSYQYHK